MKKILCLFDYVARTGYSTVSTNIVSDLRKHFGDNLQLEIIAINYFGEEFYEDKNTRVFPVTIDEKGDSFGLYAMLKKLKTENFDGFFTILDLGQITPILEVVEYIRKERKENNLKNFKIIYYFPVDCALIPELTKNLEVCDLIVTYTDYAKKEIVKHRPELLTKIKIVPHGNNFKDFYQMPKQEIEDFRKEYFEENADKFIITNVNRNQPRKDLPTTIFSFIEAKKNWNPKYPKPFLYLHCHPQDPMGWDLRLVLKHTELVEDIDYKLLPKKYETSMVSVDILNSIYNASDVLLSTTLGEGWGLSFSEAASCKIPIIAPYSTSFIEMSGYGKNAFMIMNLYPFCNLDCIVREQCDSYETADIIQEVAELKYSNSPILEKKIEDSYTWAKSIEWTNVCKNWIEYFKQVFGVKKP